MKRIWKYKWVVVGAALVVFLSVGTVAWAAGNDGGPATAPANAAATLAATGSTNAPDGDVPGALQGRRGALRERRTQFVDRQQALLDLLRDKMSPEDQATYDRLAQQAKDQRAALEKARTDLGSTLKDLRDLTQKYIDAQKGTTGTTSTSVQ